VESALAHYFNLFMHDILILIDLHNNSIIKVIQAFMDIYFQKIIEIFCKIILTI